MQSNWRTIGPCATRHHGHWKLALGLTLLAASCSGRAMAENYPLASVDFAATNAQTSIVLHTGSIVPVQKVLVSDDKLILDIDQINATDTIRTNFTNAGNISHVIMQPVNEHRIRMIIRGEHLAPPTLAFSNADTSGDSDNTELNNGLPSIDNDMQQGQPLNLSENTEAPKAGSPAPGKSASTTATDGKPTSAPSTPSTLSTDSSASKSSGASLLSSLKQALPIGKAPILGINGLAASQSSAGKSNTDLNPFNMKPAAHPDALPKNQLEALLMSLAGTPLMTYAPYGLLVILLFGLVLFIRNRFQQLQPEGNDQAEHYADIPPSGKNASFREMADAYRTRQEGRPIEEELPSRQASGKRPDSVIGLNSLQQIEPEWEQANRQEAPRQPAHVPTASLEQMLAAMQRMQSAHAIPKPVPKPSAPARQAASQYAQVQASKPAAAKPPVTGQTVEAQKALLMQQEIQQAASRTAAAKAAGAAPVNQAKAAAQKTVKPFEFKSVGATQPVNPSKKTTAAANNALKSKTARPAEQGPLPGNPEVLNFLRNVAELMEKDGKPDIAKNIHRNLSPQS